MSDLRILRPEYDDELEAIDVLKKCADQGVGFVDWCSFALMRRERIRRMRLIRG